MKKIEEQIRNDILKESNIPDVLSKVKPYAIERAYEFREENKTVKLNFHRPAKIFISCMSFAIVILLAVFIIPKVIEGNHSFTNAPSKSNAMDESSAPSNNENPGYSEDPKLDASEEKFDDFSAYYSGMDVANKLEGEELKSYYASVASCVNAGLDLPETKGYLGENYSNEDVSEYEESIEIILFSDNI